MWQTVSIGAVVVAVAGWAIYTQTDLIRPAPVVEAADGPLVVEAEDQDEITEVEAEAEAEAETAEAAETEEAASDEGTDEAEITSEETATEDTEQPTEEVVEEAVEIPAPAFDVVRVEADGMTVIAGTGPAGWLISILVDGEVIGDVAFDKTTGEFFYGTGDDKTVIDITKAQPLTDSFFNIGIPTAKEFKTLRTDLKDDRTSLKRYTSYLKNVDDANVGLSRLADEMSSYFKTLLSSNAKKYDLTESELALRIAKGELQGLIGRSRIETVGGGVMTEQDALRIISNLGGNVDFLQNPEVVRAQISRMFEDKYNSYNGKLRDYNIALDSRYRSLGYEELEPLEIDASILDPKVAENLGLDVPPEDPDPTEGGLSVDDINAMPYDELINIKDEIYSTLSVDALKAIRKRIMERK